MRTHSDPWAATNNVPIATAVRTKPRFRRSRPIATSGTVASSASVVVIVTGHGSRGRSVGGQRPTERLLTNTHAPSSPAKSIDSAISNSSIARTDDSIRVPETLRTPRRAGRWFASIERFIVRSNHRAKRHPAPRR